MKPRLEFFYDYVSVYSYLANHVVNGFDGVDVVHRPMFLGAVMQATGNRPPATVAAKGKYLTKDVYRWIDAYGIPFKFNSIFPQKTLGALRLAVAAQRSGVFERVHPLLFEAAFVTDRDLGEASVLKDIVTAAGVDSGDLLSDIGDQSIKDELKANTDEAVERGVFGAPTFFVGEQMFFGNDRFDFIRRALNVDA
jgi:2-hydroxychromene-2-carboxylate isomerase